jgi:5,10-methenyltetrahydromethanopterin hydrogenase
MPKIKCFVKVRIDTGLPCTEDAVTTTSLGAPVCKTCSIDSLILESIIELMEEQVDHMREQIQAEARARSAWSN